MVIAGPKATVRAGAADLAEGGMLAWEVDWDNAAADAATVLGSPDVDRVEGAGGDEDRCCFLLAESWRRVLMTEARRQP